MSKVRTCTGCGKDFEQVYGGRPRKKCYDCVPARLQKSSKDAAGKPTSAPRAGGQNDAVLDSVPKKEQGALSTAPVQAAPSSVHCAWCKAYTSGQPFCNEQHRSLFAQKVADAKRGRPRDSRDNGVHKGLTKKRPIERVRERLEDQQSEERSRRKQAASMREAA